MPEHHQIQQSKKPDTIFQKQSTPVNQTPVSNPYSIIQRAKINPKSLTHADIMQLQRTIGNRAVGRLLSGIGNTSTAQQATVQRQEIPEEEEPLQGKMTETIQRQEIPEEPLQGKFEDKPEMDCPSCFAAPIVQKQEIPEEEEPLQGKFTKTVQRQEIPEEEEPLQGKMVGTVQRQEIPEEEEPLQTKMENNTGMPDNLKAGVENLSGIDMNDVRVQYNSSKPTEVGALAYTQGADIHVAPGQERHLPHEAWHVVQQKQGRVQPTMQLKDGVPVNNDAELEREADIMGGRAVDSFLQVKEQKTSQKPKYHVYLNSHTCNVQRVEIPVFGGTFKPRTDANDKSEEYKAYNDKNIGAEMTLLFKPKIDLPATQVHLVQTVKDIITNQENYDKLHQKNVGFKDKKVPNGNDHAGWGIDMEFYQKLDAGLSKILEDREQKLTNTINMLEKSGRSKDDPQLKALKDQLIADKRSHNPLQHKLNSLDPRYAQSRLNSEVPVYSTSTKEETTGWAAIRNKVDAAWSPIEGACLRDRPCVAKGANCISGMKFEVAALAEGGGGDPFFVGSVNWGWRLNNQGKSEIVDLSLANEGQATDSFFAAVRHFNQLSLENPDDPKSRFTPMKLPGKK